MDSTLQIILGLLGGLAIFLYGMTMMSSSLQKVAGDKMRKILNALTSNVFFGIIAGVVATMLLQSSSATTSMVVGFVGAGLMTLPQGISVIMGANIGTTVTAQIVAFDMGNYIWLLVFIGFVVNFAAKKERTKNIGEVIFAFGLLFVGIETMGSTMAPLASSDTFVLLIEQMSDIPILGLLTGAMMTVLVQSSSATIAVLQNFAATPMSDGTTSILGLQGAIPIMLGSNIGTTITAILASIGQSKDAKRAAAAQATFNIVGALLFLLIIPWYAEFIAMISTKGVEVSIISRQIANAHTIFNIVNCLAWMPFVGVLVKIVNVIVRGDDKKEVDEMVPRYLDYNILNQPTFAIHLAAQEIVHCAELNQALLIKIEKGLLDNDREIINEATTMYSNILILQKQTIRYFSNIFTTGRVTEIQAEEASVYMRISSEIERIAQRCHAIIESANDKIDIEGHYTKDGADEMRRAFEIIISMFDDSIRALQEKGDEKAKAVVQKHDLILDLESKLRKNHIIRLNNCECKPEMTAAFTDPLFNLECIGVHCVNIANAIISNGIAIEDIEVVQAMIDEQNDVNSQKKLASL